MLRKERDWFVQSMVVVIALMVAAVAMWALPPTQDLKGVVVSAKGLPIAAAVCTLKGVGLPAEGLDLVTNERGQFSFPGLQPGAYDLTCAAVGHLPAMEAGLKVTTTPLGPLTVVLPELEKLHQSVEVHETATPLATQSTAPSGHVTSRQLDTLPLVHEQFLAALPLVPGVVRTPDGKINIKGSTEAQGMLLVDNTEMVDPITGSYSIDLPVDAIKSVEVSKAPYNAAYGHFSGGLTSVVTKPPSSKWDVQLYDVVPGFLGEAGHLHGVDGNSPRIRFTGPLHGDRLTMSESFTYFMYKQVVRGLAWPHDLTIRQGVNSFTNFQYVASQNHLLTFNFHLFPVRQEFADINSLVPQTASSNYGQRGFSAGFTDRRVVASGGLLSTTFQYTRFSSYGHGQGTADMLVTPNGWGGNFFNAYTRKADKGEARETYQYPQRTWLGRHELKVGGDLVYRNFTGVSTSMPVNILTVDGSLAEQITFSGPGALDSHDIEGGVFAQDHWAFGERFAVDAGLRVSGQDLGEACCLFATIGLRLCARQRQSHHSARGSRCFLRGCAPDGGQLYRQSHANRHAF